MHGHSQTSIDDGPFFLSPGAGRGGGIFNTGTLHLVGSIVDGNSTHAGFNGQGGYACGPLGINGSPGGDGAGIYNEGGTVTTVSTTIAANAAGQGGPGEDGDDSRYVRGGCDTGGYGSSGGPGGSGGGIYNDHGTVTLSESAVYGNTSGRGGAAGAGGYGSKIGGPGGDGGQGGFGGGIYNNGMLTVINTTITGNVTGNGGPGGAGGPSGSPGGAGTPGQAGIGGIGAVIYHENGQAIFLESTVAANVDGTGRAISPRAVPNAGIFVLAGELTEIDTIVSQDDCYANSPSGQINDGFAAGDGHLNLTWPGASCPGILANPLLGPLAENGGPTPTMAITPPSPAIGRIPPAGAGCTPPISAASRALSRHRDDAISAPTNTSPDRPAA